MEELKNVDLDSVKYVSHLYDSGDKRSCGVFNLTVSTNLGELVLESVFGTDGSPQETVVKLNDVKLECDELECDKFPDFGTPHYYAGDRAVNRFKKTVESESVDALKEWLASVQES